MLGQNEAYSLYKSFGSLVVCVLAQNCPYLTWRDAHLHVLFAEPDHANTQMLPIHWSVCWRAISATPREANKNVVKPKVKVGQSCNIATLPLPSNQNGNIQDHPQIIYL